MTLEALMQMIWEWLPKLERSDKVELIKMVIDKFLLALVIAFATYLFSRRLERFKSFLTRRGEIEKFTMPRVAALMEDADRLSEEGTQVLQALDREWSSVWKPWLSRLVAEPLMLTEGALLSEDASTLLGKTAADGTTLRDHLLAKAADANQIAAIEKLASGDEPVFLSLLAYFYFDPAGSVFDHAESVLGAAFLSNAFRRVTGPQRAAFFKKADAFLFKAKNVIPADRDRPLEGVMVGVRSMKHAVEYHPEGGGIEMLINGHMAIASQLRDVIVI